MKTVSFKGMPLTIPIEDENRAALAYNMLYSMAEDGIKFSLGDSFRTVSEADIAVINEDGTKSYPPLDPEWWADINQPRAYYEELTRQDGNKYTVMANDDGNSIKFLPVTRNVDKAQEMLNFMKFGLHPSVSLSMNLWDKDWEDYYEMKIPLKDMCIADQNGNRMTEISDPDWCNTQYMNDNRSFAAAVASISELKIAESL